MITVGRNSDGDVVLRNHDNGTVALLDSDPETFSMVVGMLVDELNDLDATTEYVLEEYDVDDDSEGEDDEDDEPGVLTAELPAADGPTS